MRAVSFRTESPRSAPALSLPGTIVSVRARQNDSSKLKRDESQERDADTDGWRPNVVDIAVLKDGHERRTEATMFMPRFEGFFEQKH
jgi:hypothetical protein